MSVRAVAVPVDELWLATLQRLTARAAHEVKGALNGVSVNLEVVRSRAARADTAASAVLPFAESAADQLEAVVRMNEALLALGRAPREPNDLATILRQLLALLVPAARAEGSRLEYGDETGGELLPLAVDGNAPRLVMASALLAALESKSDTVCTASVAAGVVDVKVQGGSITLPHDVVHAAISAGITVQQDARCLVLGFPRANTKAREIA